ncbi:MAG TPA: hypothetical protein PLW23_09100, partial [Bacteroidales bacterium]|nr:hypothetical protein [Bacteroidales bacterium]
MKKISLLSALLLFVIITFAQTNFTATYNFAGNETNVVSFAYNGDTYEGITPQPLLKVGVTSTSIDNHFRAKGWPLGATEGSSEFTGTIDLAKYIGFSIEPVAGYAFTITSIKFGVGRSGTGPRQLEWRGNADGFASALSTYEALNTNLTNVDGVLTCPDGNSGWTNNTLTPGVAYQDLATAAEFRLYAYNSEADGGTAGLQGNLIIEGTFVETGAAGLTITSPANNTTVYENQVEVTFSTANFVLGNDGKLEYKLNGTTAYTTTSPLTISGLVEGENIIDFQLVDMNDQALDPAVTKTLTIYYIDPSAPISNGLETFDNATLSGSSYSDGSFVGNHGITWNYLQARSQGLYPIDGNGLILKSAQESSIESQVLSGGIGSFEVKFRKAFTGANERGLELYINDELKGTSEVIPSSSEANPTIYTFSVNDINISGNVVIKIKIAGTDTQGRQITIDDIAWTSYEGTEPTLTITTPADNTTVNVNEVEVNFSTTNFDIGTAGKLEYKLNGETANYVNTTDLFTITGLQEGENTIFFQLV